MRAPPWIGAVEAGGARYLRCTGAQLDAPLAQPVRHVPGSWNPTARDFLVPVFERATASSCELRRQQWRWCRAGDRGSTMVLLVEQFVLLLVLQPHFSLKRKCY
jgi:hypothetical protein